MAARPSQAQADDTAKQQLDESKKQTKVQEETRDALKKGIPTVLG